MTTNNEPEEERENRPEADLRDAEHRDDHGGGQPRQSMPKVTTDDAPEDKVDLENLPEGFEYIEKLVEEPAPDDEEIRQETEAAEQENGGAEQQPYIAFENVYKSFGDFHVLTDVSFFVNAGETLCILGRSGVGKSVSLQQLMGFYKPDSGRILVAGEDITAFDEKQMQEIRRKVTMVFQNGALFDSLSVRENVAFPLRENQKLAEDQIQQIVSGLLEMVGVSSVAQELPAGLSTGMKRSVAIARALAAQPQAILYDEPTTMVDPLIARLMGDLIQKLKHQLHLTSIVVTHDMRFAHRLADRVLFLHEGKARFFGTLDEMKASQDEVLCQFLQMDELVLPV
jgi:phospholipid/cholesterol/gamma-HCH transport system ATP-binding protein